MNRLLFFCTLLFVSAQFAGAQRTIPLNLEQLVRDAGVIVDATVVETRTGRDPETGFLVTWVTMEVNEAFHGAAPGRMTFKQYGGEADGLANYPKHLPRYAVKERSLLFLTAPSTIGMQSPVGMQQGKFMVVEEGTVKKRVKNLVANPSLFKGLTNARLAKAVPVTAAEDASMDYQEFTALVRAAIQQIKR